MSAKISREFCSLCQNILLPEKEEGNVEEQYFDLFPKFCNCISIPFSETRMNSGMVCGGCSTLLKSALEAKKNVDCVEKGVRKLQMEVLKEMKHLQGAIGKFYDMLKLIEAITEHGSDLVGGRIKVLHRGIKQVIQELRSSGGALDKKMNIDTCHPVSVRGEGAKPEGDQSASSPETIVSDDDDDDSLASCSEGEGDNDEDNNSEGSREGGGEEGDNKDAKTGRSGLTDFLPIEPIECTEMTGFKRYVVSRAVRRKNIILRGEEFSKRTTIYGFSSPRNQYFFDYNVETGELSCGDIVAIIHDKEDPNECCLECSKCEFRAYQAKGNKHNPFDIKLLDHILAKHLEAYKCDMCNGRLFPNNNYFVDHMHRHYDSPPVHICDICGRPLSSKKELRHHKWLHLSEDEKQEAIKSGRNDSRPDRRIDGRPYQCSTCGVTFKRSTEYKRHQEVHLDMEQQTTICPVCGKLALKRTFQRHQIRCKQNSDKLPPVQCPKCPKTLLNMEVFKEHMRHMHSKRATERPHVCETCGRGFKTRWNLRSHMRTHSNERPFKCEKGCGASFKSKSNSRKHQEICKRSGTSTGKN